MRRRTFDALMVVAGLALAAVLLVAGVLLTWGHNFVSNEVRSQLVGVEVARGTAVDDAPALQQAGGVGEPQAEADVLLDQQHGQPELTDAQQHAEEVLDDGRRETG